ncbi:MAG: bacitracin transporter, ATP-binding protein [Bacillales bacterium]|jgi:ABC-2 type transport system ATP-binding protein|nr:bacitracin transporter, ATP-binding protein [Bacillales bacterium]
MSEFVLRTNNLTKKFGKNLALDHVNMEIKKGTIYGFIGRNGAGKTTLMKIVCNLASASEGTVELFGETTKEGLAKGRTRIGSLIEMPTLYPNLTAEGNMEVQCRILGLKDRKIVTETLKLVDLDGTGNKKVKEFSLGMKQRLGMALALLNQPEFLVLDEPINGLDPIGITEIREILKKLAEERGIAILISSHILTEMYLLATHYGFIENGKLIKQLSAEELGLECRQYVKLKTTNTEETVRVLQEKLNLTNVETLSDDEIRIYELTEKPELISLALMGSGIGIRNLNVVTQDLEAYFIGLTGGYAK